MYGSAADISAMEKHKHRYISATMARAVAISPKPKPPGARPTFQPKKRPETTAPTPKAHKDQKPA